MRAPIERHRFTALTCLVVLATGCSESYWVCPDGVVSTRVAIRDGDVFFSDLTREEPIGTIDDTPLAGCTEFGQVYLEGEIRHLRMFDSAVRLGGTSVAYGTNVNDGVNEFFPELVTVWGDFGIGGHSTHGLNKLRYVGGFWGLRPTPGSLQALEEVGSSRVFLLEDSALPSLRRIGGDLVYADSGEDTVAVMLPALEEVGGDFEVKSDGASLTFPSLRHVGGALNIGDSEGWRGQHISLPELVDVGGRLAFVSNLVLPRLDLPKVEAVGGELRIAGNRALTTLDGLASLRRVGGDVLFLQNWELPEDEIAALLEQLDEHGEVTTCGNADQPACEW